MRGGILLGLEWIRGRDEGGEGGFGGVVVAFVVVVGQCVE